MLRRALFFSLVLLRMPLWATTIQGTITLLNDSPFILTATVYTHGGDFLGQLTLQPGEQKNFTSNFSPSYLDRPGYPDTSITPYRITWQCAGGEFYSMCSDGSVGALIRANSCPGQWRCSPKKEQKNPEPKAAVPG